MTARAVVPPADDLIALGVMHGVPVFRFDLGPGGFRGIAALLVVMALTRQVGVSWVVFAGRRCEHDGPCRP